MEKINLKDWIMKDRERKMLLITSVIAILINLIGFKYLYPFLNFLPDSYSYLDAAIDNQSANIWPIGYSKFLRLLSCFSNSHLVLFAFQYLLLQGCVLYLIFTVACQFFVSKWLLRILIIVNVMNPLALHVCNFVSSDALFTAFSLAWFTQIFWLLFNPNFYLLIVHSITLVIVFTLRYNAMYYPIISLLAISLSSIKLYTKLIGVLVVIMPVIAFVTNTLYLYRSATGTAQFSAFGGWQLASNALFAYAHARRDKVEQMPNRFRRLHEIVERHMDSIEHMPYRPDSTIGIYYLWNENAPLKRYMNYTFRNDKTTSVFRRWALVSTLYAGYGKCLIRRHPREFMRYYLLPNVINYYAPSTEFLGAYNMGVDTVGPIVVKWFGLKSNKVRAYQKSKQIVLMELFPILLAISNVIFVVGLVGLLLSMNVKGKSHYVKRALAIVFVLWMSNFVFSVLASPIVLRYQVFPMIIAAVFASLFIDLIIKEGRAEVKMVPNGGNYLMISTLEENC